MFMFFFQIYNIEGVENKHSIIFVFIFALRTLMCHVTEMKHTTIHFLHFTQLTSQNTSLTTVSANFKRMEITKFINKLATNLYVYRNVLLYKITLGQLNNLL